MVTDVALKENWEKFLERDKGLEFIEIWEDVLAFYPSGVDQTSTINSSGLN